MENRNGLMSRARVLAHAAILMILLAMAGSVWAEGTRKLDMEESVRRALVANNRIRAARYQLFGAEAGEKVARGALGPSVNLSYDYTHYDSRPTSGGIVTGTQDQWDLGLNLNQPLFTGFRLTNEYQKAGLSREVAEHQLSKTELDVILEVQQEFLNLLKARENVRSAEDSLARLQSVLKVAQAFYDVGIKPKLDVLQAEVDVARAEQELLTARNVVQTQKVRLDTLLDYRLDEPVEYVGNLEYRPVDIDLQQALKRAFDLRPDMQAAEKNVLIGEKDMGVAGSGFYPQIDLNLDYLRFGDDPGVSGRNGEDTEEWRFRGGLQWALFEWGQTYYAYRQAKENVGKLDADLRNLRREVTFEIKRAFLNLQEAQERIAVARKAVEAAKEGFRMAQERYKNQVGTYTDVLDAQASLTEAETSHTGALADYQATLAQVYFSIGERRLSLW